MTDGDSLQRLENAREVVDDALRHLEQNISVVKAEGATTDQTDAQIHSAKKRLKIALGSLGVLTDQDWRDLL